MRFSLAIISTVILAQAAYASKHASASASAHSYSASASAAAPSAVAAEFEKRGVFDFIKKIIFAQEPSASASYIASASAHASASASAVPSSYKRDSNMQQILASIARVQASVSAAKPHPSAAAKLRNRAAEQVHAKSYSRHASASAFASAHSIAHERRAEGSSHSHSHPDGSSHSHSHHDGASHSHSDHHHSEGAAHSHASYSHLVSASASPSASVAQPQASADAVVKLAEINRHMKREEIEDSPVMSFAFAPAPSVAPSFVFEVYASPASIDYESVDVYEQIDIQEDADLAQDSFWIDDAKAESEFKGYDWRIIE